MLSKARLLREFQTSYVNSGGRIDRAKLPIGAIGRHPDHYCLQLLNLPFEFLDFLDSGDFGVSALSLSECVINRTLRGDAMAENAVKAKFRIVPYVSRETVVAFRLPADPEIYAVPRAAFGQPFKLSDYV